MNNGRDKGTPGQELKLNIPCCEKGLEMTGIQRGLKDDQKNVKQGLGLVLLSYKQEQHVTKEGKETLADHREAEKMNQAGTGCMKSAV